MKICPLILILLLSGCMLQQATPTTTPAPNPLSGTEYMLIQICGQPVLPDYPVYLHMRDDRMRGEMGCNSYQANYQEKNGTIQISLLAVTVQLCVDKDLMDQEAQYIQAWEEVAVNHTAKYQLTSNSLEILDDNGATVLFFRNAFMDTK